MANVTKDGSLAKEIKHMAYHFIIRFRLTQKRLVWTQETEENVVSPEDTLVL